jgi:hypothetical protein
MRPLAVPRWRGWAATGFAGTPCPLWSAPGERDSLEQLIDEPNKTHGSIMTGIRFTAFASLAALAFLSFASFAPPALAAPFDGSWSMLVVTTSGHCGRIKVGLAVHGGRISSTSGSFALHPIRVDGLISGSGQTRMNAVAGPRVAKGVGRFTRAKAGGKWTGTGPSGVCSGVWSAVRA